MWGIRVIRVGVFLGGLLVAATGSGCSECRQCLWNAQRPPGQRDGAETDGSCPGQIGGWKRGADRFPDEPGRVTPERIEGGLI